MPKEFCEGQTLTIVKIFTELEVEDGQEYTDDETTVSTITVKNDDGDHITFDPIENPDCDATDLEKNSDGSYVDSEYAEPRSHETTMFFEKPASKCSNDYEEYHCGDCGDDRFRCGCPIMLEVDLSEGEVLTVVKVSKKTILVEPPLGMVGDGDEDFDDGKPRFYGRIGFFNEFDIPESIFVPQEERKDRFEKRIEN